MFENEEADRTGVFAFEPTIQVLETILFQTINPELLIIIIIQVFILENLKQMLWCFV